MKKIFGRAAAAGGGGNGGGNGGGCSPSSDAAPGGGGGGGGPGETPSLPPNCGPWNVGRHKNLVRSRKAEAFKFYGGPLGLIHSQMISNMFQYMF